MMAGTQLSMLHLPGASILNVTSLILFVVYIIFFSNPQEGRKLRLRKDRQLAAILFTDIAGYTKLMAANEDEGLRAMEANRKIHKKWIKKFRGKWLKELGDGVIVIFYTVTEATLCAIEIQKEIKQTQKFSLRMGIHASEIVFTDADAFGDGMNMASRISDQAAGGEICFSDFVFQNIRNREDIKVDVAGLVQLKNVEHPVQLYKIIPTV